MNDENVFQRFRHNKYDHTMEILCKPGPKVIKLVFVLNSTEHKIFLLINVEMPTIVGILTFMSGKNSILGLSDPKCVGSERWLVGVVFLVVSGRWLFVVGGLVVA